MTRTVYTLAAASLLPFILFAAGCSKPSADDATNRATSRVDGEDGQCDNTTDNCEPICYELPTGCDPNSSQSDPNGQCEPIPVPCPPEEPTCWELPPGCDQNDPQSSQSGQCEPYQVPCPPEEPICWEYPQGCDANDPQSSQNGQCEPYQVPCPPEPCETTHPNGPCCATGVLDVHGECCPTGVLDACGHCCFDNSCAQEQSNG